MSSYYELQCNINCSGDGLTLSALALFQNAINAGRLSHNNQLADSASHSCLNAVILQSISRFVYHNSTLNSIQLGNPAGGPSLPGEPMLKGYSRSQSLFMCSWMETIGSCISIMNRLHPWGVPFYEQSHFSQLGSVTVVSATAALFQTLLSRLRSVSMSLLNSRLYAGFISRFISSLSAKKDHEGSD